MILNVWNPLDFGFSSSRSLKLDAGGYSTSPNTSQRYQNSRPADSSSTPPLPNKTSGNIIGGNSSSSLLQQLTAISKLLSTQQTVRVDQITTLLNEKVRHL